MRYTRYEIYLIIKYCNTYTQSVENGFHTFLFTTKEKNNKSFIYLFFDK